MLRDSGDVLLPQIPAGKINQGDDGNTRHKKVNRLENIRGLGGALSPYFNEEQRRSVSPGENDHQIYPLHVIH